MNNVALSSAWDPIAEADHRIANHLALLASYVRLKSSELTRRKAEPDTVDISMLLNSIEVQISGIARLHRLLSADESHESADLGDHLREICATLRSAVPRDVVITENIGGNCALPMNKIIAAAQILTEVITNAIKHGHRAGKPSFIKVSLRNDGNGSVMLDVDDNGPGLRNNDQTLASAGLGFQIVQSLAAQIGGTVKYISNDQGLCVRLTVGTSDAGMAGLRKSPAPVVPAEQIRRKLSGSGQLMGAYRR